MSKKLSPTNILHYNQFLLYLDSVHSSKIDSSKKTDSDDLKKESMDKRMENIQEERKILQLDSSLFHGYSKEDNQTLIDPNLIIEEYFIGEKRSKKKTEKRNILLEKEINSLTDLLDFIEANPLIPAIEYSINMNSLHDIKDSLKELNSMIGLNSIKTSIVDQILYFAQDLHQGSQDLGKELNSDFLHTVLYGPPGTGKTEIAKIMGKIFSKLGILKTGIFKKVTRNDLVAGYLGQTAIKTKDVIKECIGGVLFIDEAYSLGNSEKKDSFSKECIDTLCEALSHHKHELMVIIAGYEKELNECFFVYNQGLDSRFTWRYKLEKYNEKELFFILQKKIKDNGWLLDNEVKETWFHKKLEFFPCSGRDIETLWTKIKISHSKRIFGKINSNKKVVLEIDLEKGFELFMKNENKSKDILEKEKFNTILSSMYV